MTPAARGRIENLIQLKTFLFNIANNLPEVENKANGVSEN